MPRLTVEAHGVTVHCSPSQLDSTLQTVQSEAAGAMAPLGHGKAHQAASAIGGFVDDTHLYIGNWASGCAVSDLRHGVNILRRGLLREPKSSARTERLGTLKWLDRLHVTVAERLEYLEKSLGDSADKHSKATEAADKHSAELASLQAAP